MYAVYPCRIGPSVTYTIVRIIKYCPSWTRGERVRERERERERGNEKCDGIVDQWVDCLHVQ
jgi:hypothetical protein